MNGNVDQNYTARSFVLRRSGSRQPYNRDHVTSVTVVAFDRAGKILVVTEPGKGSGLPGGHVEPKLDRTHDAAVHRETWEEGRTKLCHTLRTAGVICSTWSKSKHDAGGTFMLVKAARVSSVHPFTANAEVSRREFMSAGMYTARLSGQKRTNAVNMINRARHALNRKIP